MLDYSYSIFRNPHEAAFSHPSSVITEELIYLLIDLFNFFIGSFFLVVILLLFLVVVGESSFLPSNLFLHQFFYFFCTMDLLLIGLRVLW